MTREEAIAVFKAFMDNPLFSDVHKAAFSIAMHDIKQRHEWDLNKLVLTQKDNEQEPVIDKIRAEILKISSYKGYELGSFKDGYSIAMVYVLKIIDKYKAESGGGKYVNYVFKNNSCWIRSYVD